MLARLAEIAKVCLSILMEPTPRRTFVRVSRDPEPVDDYRTAMASFHRAWPQL